MPSPKKDRRAVFLPDAAGERGPGFTGREIQDLGKAFARASLIAKAAGFDAVELHGAHGYLLAAFLSPFSNTRDDAYGGSFEGRFRFVQEVYEGVRNAVGPSYPILFRLSGREYLEGGRQMEETLRIARRLEEIGFDALDVSAGITMDAEAFTWLAPPASFPQGAFLGDAAEIKRAVGIPVIGVGKIRDPRFAEKALAEGQADFVALGRALIADPEWPNKALAGRTREIRRCISCNRCWSILYRLPIRCAINARAGRERALPMSPSLRRQRVAVVGGGPAGWKRRGWRRKEATRSPSSRKKNTWADNCGWRLFLRGSRISRASWHI